MKTVFVSAAVLLIGLTSLATPDPQDLFANVANWENSAAEQLADLTTWKGLSKDWKITLPGEASFTYPDGEKGWFRVGEALRHDGSGYWRNFYGVRFDVFLPSDTPLKGEAVLDTAACKAYGGSADAANSYSCLLYTSDAADELLFVVSGSRRIR